MARCSASPAPRPISHWSSQSLARSKSLRSGNKTTGIPGTAKAETRAGDAQGAGHDRVQGERALEVGEDVVAVVSEVLGDHDEALDGGAGVAGVVDGDSDAVVGGCECGVRVAVVQVAVADDVGADFGVDQGGAGSGGRVHNGVAFPVLDFDSLERVFGCVAVASNDHGDRLADVPHPIDCQYVVPHGLLDAGNERPGPSGDILAGQDGNDFGHRACNGRVNGDDFRVHMGSAQYGSVGGAGTLPHIIGEASAPGDKGCVLDTFHGATGVHSSQSSNSKPATLLNSATLCVINVRERATACPAISTS